MLRMSAFKRASLTRFRVPAALSVSLVLLAYSLRLFRIGEFWGAGWENPLPIFPPYGGNPPRVALELPPSLLPRGMFWGAGRALLKRLKISADNP